MITAIIQEFETNKQAQSASSYYIPLDTLRKIIKR